MSEEKPKPKPKTTPKTDYRPGKEGGPLYDPHLSKDYLKDETPETLRAAVPSIVPPNIPPKGDNRRGGDRRVAPKPRMDRALGKPRGFGTPNDRTRGNSVEPRFVKKVTQDLVSDIRGDVFVRVIFKLGRIAPTFNVNSLAHFHFNDTFINLRLSTQQIGPKWPKCPPILSQNWQSYFNKVGQLISILYVIKTFQSINDLAESNAYISRDPYLHETLVNISNKINFNKRVLRTRVEQFEVELKRYHIPKEMLKFYENMYTPTVLNENGRSVLFLYTFLFPFDKSIAAENGNLLEYYQSDKKLLRFLVDSEFYYRGNRDTFIVGMLTNLTSEMSYNLSDLGEHKILNDILAKVSPEMSLSSLNIVSQPPIPLSKESNYRLNNASINAFDVPSVTNQDYRWITRATTVDTPAKSSTFYGVGYSEGRDSPASLSPFDVRIKIIPKVVEGITIYRKVASFSNMQVVQDRDATYPYNETEQCYFDHNFQSVTTSDIGDNIKIGTLSWPGIYITDNCALGTPCSTYVIRDSFPVTGYLDNNIELSSFNEKINESIGLLIYAKVDYIILMEYMEAVRQFDQISGTESIPLQSMLMPDPPVDCVSMVYRSSQTMKLVDIDVDEIELVLQAKIADLFYSNTKIKKFVDDNAIDSALVMDLDPLNF